MYAALAPVVHTDDVMDELVVSLLTLCRSLVSTTHYLPPRLKCEMPSAFTTYRHLPATVVRKGRVMGGRAHLRTSTNYSSIRIRLFYMCGSRNLQCSVRADEDIASITIDLSTIHVCSLSRKPSVFASHYQHRRHDLKKCVCHQEDTTVILFEHNCKLHLHIDSD